MEAIAPGDERSTDHVDVDWHDRYVVPGLIDSHDHFCIHMGDGIPQASKPTEWRSISGLDAARQMLASGITFLRNAGEKGNTGVWVRQAIREGRFAGPDAILSGEPITSTGGHGWFLAVEADGPDGFRRAVRGQAKAGAEMIKLIITGGVTTPTSSLVRPCATSEEIQAGIGEAHAQGLRVGVHAYGGEAATTAIEAGVDSIEHGTFLSKDDLRKMSDSGTWLVCTSSVMTAASRDDSVAGFMRERFASVARAYRDTIVAARNLGVRITVGCDTHHASLAEELEFLVSAGYEPVDALRACTVQASEFLHLADEIGTVDVGKRADMVALSADPIDDVRHLRDVCSVVVGGKVFDVVDGMLQGSPMARTRN